MSGKASLQEAKLCRAHLLHAAQQPGSVSRAVTDIPGPAFLSHTVGIAVAVHVCAGVQITLSVSLRPSKEQDVNAAKTQATGSVMT